MDELRKKVQGGNFDIAAITESWAKEDINDSELKIDGYTMYRKDRLVSTGTTGGGVLLYVKESLQSCILQGLTNDEFQDSVWCKIKLEDHSVVVGVCYRSTSSTKENNDSLLKLLDKAASQNSTSHLLIYGDFNYPEINYEGFVVKGSIDTDAYRFFHKTNDLFLYQNVNYWTRCRPGQQPSILDYVFTDEDNLVEDIKYTAPLGKSDHICIELIYIWNQIDSDDSTPKYNFWKGDYSKINEELRVVDWDKELITKNMEQAWAFFRDTITRLTQVHIPLKQTIRNKARKKHEWMTKSTIKELKKRDNLWRRYRDFSSERNYKAYTTVRNRVVKLIRQDKVAYQRKLARQFRSNPKRFYGYVRRMQTVKDKVTVVKTSDGNLTANDHETAEALCTFFKDVFVNEGYWNGNAGLRQDPEMEIEVCEEQVTRILKNLQPDKSAGPDGIHPLLLRNVAEQISRPLTILYNKSINSGEVPEDWRKANIIPIYKNGPRNEPGNYRPVSLTSVVCKILERIIKERLTHYLDEKKHISPNQHGFVSHRSCLTNLLEALEKWTEYLDAGNGIDVIFLDYRKAFDTVPHKRLLSKLQQAGITGKVFNWIQAFLQSREMRVVVNGHCSSWTQVISGVPQGSVIGPLLFLIYVNDLPDWIKSEMRMFADDTKVWKKITELKDCIDLQEDLTRLQHWSNTWLLQFHPEKCKVMHVGHKHRFQYRITQSNQTYILNETEEEKDLGIIVTNNLSASTQCAEAAKKATRILGMVRRQFKNMDKECFILLYKTFIRPHLEYAIQVWSPYKRGDIECLEKVQRRATKLVFALRNCSYEDRLVKLGLTTLEERRRRGDLIEAYKIITGKEKVRIEDFFNFHQSNYELRGHQYKLVTKRSRLEVRRNYFSQRVVGPWNRLPSHVVEATTVNTFKNRFDRLKKGTS